MASKGYSSAALVAQHLGRSLSADQAAEATALLESAELVIDEYMHRAYAVASITAEKHMVVGGLITLKHRPITAISALTVISYPAIGATASALVSETSYDLLDATEGLVYLGDGYDGFQVSVTYTAPITVPARVRDGTTLLLAHWLRPTLDGLTDDVASYSIAGDLSVTFKEGSKGYGSIPDAVKDMLGRRLVLV